MENTAETIAGIKDILSLCRAESQGMVNDPVVRQWNSIDIDQHGSILSDLDLNPRELLATIAGYQKTVDEMRQQVTRLENELSNLEADLRLNSLPADEARRLTGKLLHAAQELQTPLARIRQCRATLVAAAKDIQEKLSLKNLLQIARVTASRSSREREMFEKGYLVFKLVTPDNNFKEDFLNIHDVSAKADRIETKLRKLELPAIPELAKSILLCQIDTCYEALKEIHRFLTFITHSLKDEISQIDIINEDISAFRAKPFSVILESLAGEGEKLGRNINEFQYKANFIKEIENIDLLLDTLQTFYESLRYSYFPHLAATMNTPGFRLNPRVVAAETGRSYFRGLRGLIRRIKLALTVVDNRSQLDAAALSQKIFIALSSCPYYYCGVNDYAARLAAFIDGLISTFSKPYPYEELHRLIKEAIDKYGSLIEKDFAEFKAERKPDTAPDAGSASLQQTPEEVPLGRLLYKIEAGATHLRSLQNRS